MVIAAIKNGFQILGFSDHAFIPSYINPSGQDLYMSPSEFEKNYKNEIILCQNKYPNIKLYIGLETEYVSEAKEYYEMLRKKVDYLVLGAHFFYSKNKNNKSVSYNTYFDITSENCHLYALAVKEALDTKLFSILAHPDLYMRSIDEWNENTWCAATIIIEAAIKNGVYLEINLGGGYAYPHIDFWRLVKKYNYHKILIGYDAHSPSDLEPSRLHHVAPILDLMKGLIVDSMEEFK